MLTWTCQNWLSTASVANFCDNGVGCCVLVRAFLITLNPSTYQPKRCHIPRDGNRHRSHRRIGLWFFYTENVSNRFFRNANNNIPDYRASHFRRQYCFWLYLLLLIDTWLVQRAYRITWTTCGGHKNENWACESACRYDCLVYKAMGWSQRPGGLRHGLSSLARTLGSWVRIPLKSWMSLCFYYVFVFSCV
jgi:hypothetical protein